MSVFSQLFNIGQGNLIKDPQRMCWGVALETMLSIGYINTPATDAILLSYPITGADFWTAMGALNTYSVADSGFTMVNQVSVDDTYATITDISSGSGGVLTHLILPGASTAGDVSTVRITLDGVVLTALAFTSVNVTDRFFAGPTKNILTYGGRSSTEGAWASATSEIVSGLAVRKVGSTEATKQGLHLLTPDEALGTYPCLQFNSTLKVEMKSSDFSSTNNRDDCAAIFILNQY